MTYEYISTLKSSEKGDIRLVRDENGTLFVQRYRSISPDLLKKLTELSCPYIAKTLDFSEDENGFFTIEEHIDGTPASEIHLTEKQATNALLELCGAIEALHRAEIVHRDIKPSNIIVGKDGHIRLIDFDTARLMKEYQSHDTGYLGTIGYAPPEQFGFMQTDARSDIYAFGMTMEELLSNSANKLKLRRIIAKCTAFDPEKRYSDISLVERALKRKVPAIPVLAVICAAALIVLGALVLSQKDEPQGDFIPQMPPSETEEIVTSEITAEPAASKEESEPAIQTAESSENISAETASEEVIIPETAETADTTEMQAEEEPPEEASAEVSEEMSQETHEDAPEETTEALAVNRMTFETLQDENGRNYDSYEYVFYDDPDAHGVWLLCGTSKSIPKGDIYLPGTLPQLSPQYLKILPEGVIEVYNSGMRELAGFRWTSGYILDESTDIHKAEQMFVLTNTDGTRHIIYERKQMYNGDDTMPNIYFIYRQIGE